jgi:hypothetical protein
MVLAVAPFAMVMTISSNAQAVRFVTPTLNHQR